MKTAIWRYDLSTVARPVFRWVVLSVVSCLVTSCGTTANSPSEPVAQALRYPARVALFSDMHMNRGTNQALFRRHLERVVEEVNKAGVDLVLIPGDLTEDGTPDEYSTFRQIVSKLQAPAWWVPGNHDVGAKPIKKDAGAVNAWRVARYELKMGPSFFVREHAGVRVIGVNGSIFGSGFRKERQQWEMLERELAKPASKPTVLLSHYPVFVNKPDEPGGEYWNIEPVPRLRLLSLIKLGNVETVLSGHLHRPITNRLDGTLFYSTPPVSFGLPAKKQPVGWSLVEIPKKGMSKVQFNPIPE